VVAWILGDTFADGASAAPSSVVGATGLRADYYCCERAPDHM
jgi:hypothetical protein